MRSSGIEIPTIPKRELDMPPITPMPVDASKIEETVANEFGVGTKWLYVKSNSPEYVNPRQVAMYLWKTEARRSYPWIGERFQKHHTTVMHAIQCVEDRMSVDGIFRAKVEKIKERLKGE
jgi:chromosomal replication initiator protein